MKRLNNLQEKLLKLFNKKNRALHSALLKVITKNIKNKDIKNILNKEIISLCKKQNQLVDDTLIYAFILVSKDKRKAYKIIKENWNDKHYSDRIYKDKVKLKKTILREISRGINNKDNNEDIIKRVSRRLDISLNNSKRLVDTEMTAVINRAQIEKAVKKGHTKFEFVAIIDDRTSDICRELNGKVFNIDELKIGINSGPLHPHCRSRIKTF